MLPEKKLCSLAPSHIHSSGVQGRGDQQGQSCQTGPSFSSHCHRANCPVQEKTRCQAKPLCVSSDSHLAKAVVPKLGTLGVHGMLFQTGEHRDHGDCTSPRLYNRWNTSCISGLHGRSSWRRRSSSWDLSLRLASGRLAPSRSLG